MYVCMCINLRCVHIRVYMHIAFAYTTISNEFLKLLLSSVFKT